MRDYCSLSNPTPYDSDFTPIWATSETIEKRRIRKIIRAVWESLPIPPKHIRSLAQLRAQALSRCWLALRLREEQGFTYKRIGLELQVTGARARQIVAKACRIRDRQAARIVEQREA